MLTKWGTAVVAVAASSALMAPPSDTNVPEAPEAGPSLTNAPQLPKPPPIGARGELGLLQPPSGAAANVSVKVERDGSVSITEQVTVPGGQRLVRRIPLKVPAGEEQDRVYGVRDVVVEGAGKTESNGEQLIATFDGGAATLEYKVDGAVADVGGAQQVRWQVASGWDGELSRVSASFSAPTRETPTVDCFAGPLGSDRQCSLAEIDHSGVVRVEQDKLAAGERVDLVVQLPAGTVPANARFEQIASVGGAFALTTVAGLGFGALALFSILGALAVWLLRRRDKGALTAGTGPVDVLLRDGDRVSFASPDGVLPGQVGTVVDETVDVVDVSGTVVDLAVRNYLWIAEVRGAGAVDWQLTRRNAPDEHLVAFEREIYTALLPEGTDSVLLSELRGRGTVDLRVAGEAMYADVAGKGWFSRRPDKGRSKLTWAGVGLVALGLAGTVVLTFTAGHALLGVAVVLAGVAALLGSSWVPPRTSRGRRLVGQVRGLLEYLHTVEVADIPVADRELVFSRSLPYAIVLGAAEHWLRTFEGLDPSADGSAGLYWFGGLEGDRDLRRFAAHLPSFLSALDGLLAESGHLRSLRPEPVPA
ncbi:DUF2207 domain-containing protein [Amycolatopsis sp. QT-25]|uniref:DUF2207 domain-containing protein n=1 Tax=Amycolatopsis sp. QT-25 TaxID=3034022 RepID=UPI0023ED3732|nr:DUF2207 domain-containing protein [Amycolatopsis sp. QT-25]WET83473.1 DUF2207 domain-containing protein [Amycolatopsis sp. QT-25]